MTYHAEKQDNLSENGNKCMSKWRKCAEFICQNGILLVVL